MEDSRVQENAENNGVARCLQEVDAVLSAYLFGDSASQWKTERCNELLSRISRNRKEFDSKLFFAVIFGPVKSGKSTLTNCFARRYVSPSKFGVECTVRPSFVIRADEDAIYEYEKISMRDTDRECFDLVLDYLRGIVGEEELRGKVFEERFDLTREMVEKKLVQNNDKSPLVTVIKVKDGGLVSSEVAIVDMPGLDGQNCNLQDSPMYHWLLERTDLMIFVQSSMAAINVDTVKFMEVMRTQSKNPPMWLVQNMIDAKYWRPLAERMQDADNQLQETKAALEELIKPEEGDLSATTINLGKAYDGFVSNNQELLDESGFLPFERNIKKLLTEQRIQISERIGLRTIANGVEELLDAFFQNQTELDGKIQNVCEHKDQLCDFLSMPSTINYELSCDEEIKAKVREVLQTLLENLGNGVERLRERVNKSMSGEQLNAILQEFVRSTISNANSSFFNCKSLFGYTITNIFNEAIVKAEEPFFEAVKNRLTEINQELSIDVPEITSLSSFIESYPCLTVDSLPEVFSKSGFDYGNYRVKEKYLGILGNIRYTGIKNQEQVARVVSHLTEFLRNSTEGFLTKLMGEITGEYCEKRRSYYIKQMEDMENREKAKWDRIIDENQLLVKELEKDIAPIRHLLETLKDTQKAFDTKPQETVDLNEPYQKKPTESKEDTILSNKPQALDAAITEPESQSTAEPLQPDESNDYQGPAKPEEMWFYREPEETKEIELQPETAVSLEQEEVPSQDNTENAEEEEETDEEETENDYLF